MPTTTAQPVTPEFLTGFVQRYGDAWRTLDPSRVVTECTVDTVWHVPGVEGPLEGREAVSEWLAALFRMVPDARFDYPVGVPFLTLDGSAAAARFRLDGTMLGPMEPPGFAPTGQQLTDEGIEIYERFEDGLLARCTIVFDALHVARQIGAAPPPGGGAEKLGVLLQRLQARRSRRAAAEPR